MTVTIAFVAIHPPVGSPPSYSVSLAPDTVIDRDVCRFPAGIPEVQVADGQQNYCCGGDQCEDWKQVSHNGIHLSDR